MSNKKTGVLLPLLAAIASISLLILIVPLLVSGELEAVPESFYFEQNIPESKPHHAERIFCMMTLNIGHGRGKGLHQILQNRKKIRANADKIADLIKADYIDISALQEVDGSTIWNRGLNFIEYLAENSGCQHGIWSKNVDAAGIRYGTALISDLPYSKAESYTFKARPFILPKGFTIGFFKPSESSDTHVCVVSIHLAPLFPFIRKKQTEAIINAVKDINGPLVIAGDFNCGYRKHSAVRVLMENLNLKAWEPNSETQKSFHARRRIDWILISDELEFMDYRVVAEKLSDHSAIEAVIKY